MFGIKKKHRKPTICAACRYHASVSTSDISGNDIAGDFCTAMGERHITNYVTGDTWQEVYPLCRTINLKGKCCMYEAKELADDEK